MLTRLTVSNFAIIDQLDLQFQKGLTIITGETGAGKSILLGALRLILGERADLKQLNNESKKCVIEAQFNLKKLNLKGFFDENEVDYDEETILRRELLPSGKSRAFVNDTPVTLNVLQELGEKLIDIHSQFNTANLLEEAFQFEILDAYAEQLPLVKEFTSLYQLRTQKKAEYSEVQEQLAQLSREADYKKFLLEELQNAQLNAEEWQEIEQKQRELQNVDEINSVLQESLMRLDNGEMGILNELHEISHQLSKISGYGQEFEQIFERIQSAKIELTDLYKEISYKVEHLESDPEHLMLLNQRIDTVNALLHKHRFTQIQELIDLQTQLENESGDFAQLEEKLIDLEKEIKQIEKDLSSLGQKISKGRKAVIPQVEKEILNSLAKLGMENSVMEIQLNESAKFKSNGTDEIEFLFSANKGLAPKPLGKTVSGGERSRLMLAIKKIISHKLNLPTLILDEIDTGVSGKVANEMGNMMKEMAENLQLLSITHLPQVAAKADQHYKVQKKTSEERTLTEVIQLSEEERIQEIAALLSGSNVTETAIHQAKELIHS